MAHRHSSESKGQSALHTRPARTTFWSGFTSATEAALEHADICPAAWIFFLRRYILTKWLTANCRGGKSGKGHIVAQPTSMNSPSQAPRPARVFQTSTRMSKSSIYLRQTLFSRHLPRRSSHSCKQCSHLYLPRAKLPPQVRWAAVCRRIRGLAGRPAQPALRRKYINIPPTGS